MNARAALICFYVAIIFLVIFAGVIVVKLIFWPPCTQMGNACVVDGWSVAGLAAMVLAVAATMLAILGAVAVAAWWTSLNARVNDQVRKHYTAQQKEVDARVDRLLAKQEKKVTDQLGAVQTKLQTAENRIGAATADIDELEVLTHDFLGVAVDGIMISSPGSLETWAVKVTALHKFPRVPLMMAIRYLEAVEGDLVEAEREVMSQKDELDVTYKTFDSLATVPHTDAEQRRMRVQRIGYIGNDLRSWLDRDARGGSEASHTLDCWEIMLRWKTVAVNEKADTESLQSLEGKIGAYQFKIDQLKLGRDQLKEQTQRLLDLTDRYLEKTVAEKDTSATKQP